MALKVPASIERLAHLAHQVEVVVQVVHRGQHRAQHLAAAVQVVQVGAAETVAPALVPAHAACARAGVSCSWSRAAADRLCGARCGS